MFAKFVKLADYVGRNGLINIFCQMLKLLYLDYTLKQFIE